MYETYIGKTIDDHIHDFKTLMNSHITETRSGVSTYSFPIHVFNCSQINNKQLEEPVLYMCIYIKLLLDKLSSLLNFVNKIILVTL